MKKSFSLLFTILLLSIFSYLSIKLLETKSFRSKSIQSQYLYIQAKNHNKFLKEYLKSIDLKDINKIEIKDKSFFIYANIKKINSKYFIQTYIRAKNQNISLYDKFYK